MFSEKFSVLSVLKVRYAEISCNDFISARVLFDFSVPGPSQTGNFSELTPQWEKQTKCFFFDATPLMDSNVSVYTQLFIRIVYLLSSLVEHTHFCAIKRITGYKP